MELDGCSVLDLYCGSGALALEALSRGAGSAVLVDQARVCVRVVEGNADTLGYGERCSVMRLDARVAAERLSQQGRRFDLVLADPPYDGEPHLLVESVDALNLVEPGGWLVLEHAHRRAMPARQGRLHQVVQRRYGDSAVTLYRACSGPRVESEPASEHEDALHSAEEEVL